MSEAPIKHHSLSENIYQRLLRQILDGRLPVGARLKEEKLCVELGVSRTPLREALIRLVREGILEQLPRRGCTVRALPDNEIEQLMECRCLLECLALREWFGKIDRKRVGQLTETLHLDVTTDNSQARKTLLTADEELHALIVAACGNRFLVEQIKRLQLLCRPYRVLRCTEAADLQSILAERQRIVDAICNDDVEAAVSGLSAHFESSRCYYLTENKD